MSFLKKVKEVLEGCSRNPGLAKKRAREFAQSYIMAEIVAGVISTDGNDFTNIGVYYSDCTLCDDWCVSQSVQKCIHHRRGYRTNHESEGKTTITMAPHSDFIRNIMGPNIAFDKRGESDFMAHLAEGLKEMGFDAFYSDDLEELVIHRVTKYGLNCFD